MNQQIYLLGDSIRLGYCGIVRESLADVAEVVYPAENSRSTYNVIELLNEWRRFTRPEEVKIVHFNCGHWDAAYIPEDNNVMTTLDCYYANVKRIIHRLRCYYPNATIVYATTTRMNDTIPDNHTTADLLEYNRVGVRAAEESGVLVNDLFAVTKDWDASMFRDSCHPIDEGYNILGKTVATYLRKLLKT